MSSPALNYEELLKRLRPERIEMEETYQNYLAEHKCLMEKGDGLTGPETKLMVLLGVLLEDYEKRRFKLGETSTPRSILLAMMEEHNLKHKDIWEIFGSKGTASEVMNGKRTISKVQAKRLGAKFHIPAELFF